MYDSAFTPGGSSYLVGTVPVLVRNGNGSSFRCANVSSAALQLGWAPYTPSGIAPSSLNALQATTSASAPNVMTMIGNTVEVFTLPANLWFLASGASIEVTPGEGV